MKKAISILFLLSSCSLAPKYQNRSPVVCEYTASSNQIYDPTQFCSLFASQELHELITKALIHNKDYLSSLQRIEETRQLYGIQKAELLPKFDMIGVYERQRYSQTLFDSTFLGPAVQDLFQVGIDASWEIDLFGRIRSAKQAAMERYEATQAESSAIKLSLVAEIAKTYFQRQILIHELSAGNKIVTTLELLATFYQDRVHAGLDRSDDIERNIDRIDSQKSANLLLAEGISQAESRLATLIGAGKEGLGELSSDLPSLPSRSIASGIPASLLSRRPDLQKAEHLIKEALSRIGEAKADLYPRFQILGGYSQETTEPGMLWKSASRSWNFMPNVKWPILYFGRIRSLIRAREASSEATILEFQSLYLRALEEVENALTSFTTRWNQYEIDLDRYEAISRLALYAKTLEDAGIESSILYAQRQILVLDLYHSLLQRRKEILEAYLSSFKALGGDWSCSSTQ